MRGSKRELSGMWSYITPEQRVASDHPLRTIRKLVDEVLKQLSPRFSRMYAKTGRPSIAPERLLRALVLQVLYSIRSERLLVEAVDYSILFRWFVGMNLDEPVWDASTFSKNRERLLEGEVAQAFFEQVMRQAQASGLLSDEHFTVDGTLIRAWAGQKSFKPKAEAHESRSERDGEDPGNPTVDFRGQKRRNDTHESSTDPEARLYKKAKGQEAQLCYQAHVLMENRNGLAVNARVTWATGTAEREAALKMVAEIPGQQRITVGADKAYDTADFVRDLRELQVTPHLAQNDTRRASNIDGRTTRHPGYQISQNKRKRVEEIFGWLKTIALMRQTRYRGREKVGWMFTFATAVYNLVRMRNLGVAAA